MKNTITEIYCCDYFLERRGDAFLNEIEKVKEELRELTVRVDDIEKKTDETAEHVVELRKEQKENHKELQGSQKEMKNEQKKVVDENLEQTKILNRIEERYQTQVEVAQKNEEKTLTHNKWLLGALWGLLAVVMIAVITASVTAIVP